MEDKVIGVDVNASALVAVDDGWLAEVGFAMKMISLHLQRPLHASDTVQHSPVC